MIDSTYINNLRIPTKENPLRVLTSACLVGITCGFDGSANGESPGVLKLLQYTNVNLITFCPEEFSFGTPREMCDIHGGTGVDVLNGKAKVLTETGKDWTKKMIMAAEKMLEIAQQEHIEIALLMDISAACGSQVIYNGNRFGENKIYQIGTGVCTALLIMHGFKVLSQRDFALLEALYAKIDPTHQKEIMAKDHSDTQWYKEYFKK